MKKVTEKNLRVNDIIYNQENASELFEVEALQDGLGFNSGMSFATMLTRPAKQPTVPQMGSSTLFISTSLFRMFSGNASSASINMEILKGGDYFQILRRLVKGGGM
jgi:hypothetical protein